MSQQSALAPFLEGLTQRLCGKPLHVQLMSGDTFVLMGSATDFNGNILKGHLGTLKTENIIPIEQIQRIYYNSDDLS